MNVLTHPKGKHVHVCLDVNIATASVMGGFCSPDITINMSTVATFAFGLILAFSRPVPESEAEGFGPALFFCCLAGADINANAFTAATHQSLTKAPLAFKLSHSVAAPEGQGRVP